MSRHSPPVSASSVANRGRYAASLVVASQRGAGGAPVCTPNHSECVSNSIRTCDASGQWAAPVACVHQACLSTTNNCGGACAPGEARCKNNAVETCAQGAWANPSACTDQACVQGTAGSGATTATCAGVCTPETFYCTSNSIGERCNATGSYVSNSSAVTCNCHVPGRFTYAGPNLLLDTNSRQGWFPS